MSDAKEGKLKFMIAMLFPNGSCWWISKNEGQAILFTNSEIIDNHRWEFEDEHAARSAMLNLIDATYVLDQSPMQLGGILLRKFRLLHEDVIDNGDAINFRFRRGVHLQLYKAMVYRNGEILLKEPIGEPKQFSWKTIKKKEPDYAIAS
jgi:hypothetical protein